MSDRFGKILDAVQIAVLWFALGLVAGQSIPHVSPRLAPAPLPAPAPATKPAPRPHTVAHAGHFTISYIEPRYGSPASAAVRDGLAGVDWKPLDCTFRSYVEGQEELKTLGFVPRFTASDLPVLFVQESGPKGAPIIDTVKGPASAAAVLTRIQELRGK
jgi:hypothetical protein